MPWFVRTMERNAAWPDLWVYLSGRLLLSIDVLPNR